MTLADADEVISERACVDSTEDDPHPTTGQGSRCDFHRRSRRRWQNKVAQGRRRAKQAAETAKAGGESPARVRAAGRYEEPEYTPTKRPDLRLVEVDIDEVGYILDLVAQIHNKREPVDRALKANHRPAVPAVQQLLEPVTALQAQLHSTFEDIRRRRSHQLRVRAQRHSSG